MEIYTVENFLPPIFVFIALLFTGFLFYFVRVVSHSGGGFSCSKIFCNTDPTIKVFYQFFIGTAFAYILFMVYLIDMGSKIFFILGELILGLSLIGFSYLITPLFLRRGK
jgi:hypothetical protein